jgi:AmmeMemoRadiSam system protein B
VNVRPAAVAGLFYPEHPRELAETVDGLLRDARADTPPPAATPPRALIAPHAGYVYSGPIAARAYATIAPDAPIRRVAIVGPAHRVHLRGMALPSADAFATPLGDVALADCDEVAGRRGVVIDDGAHRDEHCIEVQLPFLQRVLASFEIVPIVVGQCEADLVAQVLTLMSSDPATLVVISSDLSHYETYASASRHDNETAAAILDGRGEAIGPYDACGAYAIRGLLDSARDAALAPELLDLRSSGDTAGGHDRVVGYGAFAFAPYRR